MPYWVQVFSFIAVGATAGVFSGLFGIGGGLIIVPCLMFFAGLSQPVASATSLVALLLPVGLLGVIEHFRAGRLTLMHAKFGLFVALGLFMGTFFGAKLMGVLPELWLKRGFSLFLVGVAAKIWMG